LKRDTTLSISFALFIIEVIIHKEINLAAKITLEEATKRIDKFYNNTIEILEYTNIRSLMKVRCKICGTEVIKPAKNVVNGKFSCRICFHKTKKPATLFSKERAIKELARKGCVFNSEIPTIGFEKTDILYPCGHINHLSFNMFLKINGCGQCWKNTFYINRYSENDLIKIAEDNDLKFIGFQDDYKGGSSIMSYQCKEGHITDRMVKDFAKYPTCKTCKNISRALANRGDGSSSWKGGISKIWVAARARLDPWVLRSLKSGEYKCCITGQSDVLIDVHHIRSFKLIAIEALREFGIEDECYYWKTYNDYGEDVLFRIVELNNKYGDGALMRKDIHHLYHKIYGHGNNTEEQFEEFKQRIKSGDIILPD
jgi:hypothetical protein